MLCGSRNAILRGVYAFAKRLDDAGASRLLWRRLFAPKTLDERRGKTRRFCWSQKEKISKISNFLENFLFFKNREFSKNPEIFLCVFLSAE